MEARGVGELGSFYDQISNQRGQDTRALAPVVMLSLHLGRILLFIQIGA